MKRLSLISLTAALALAGCGATEPTEATSATATKAPPLVESVTYDSASKYAEVVFNRPKGKFVTEVAVFLPGGGRSSVRLSCRMAKADPDESILLRIGGRPHSGTARVTLTLDPCRKGKDARDKTVRVPFKTR